MKIRGDFFLLPGGTKLPQTIYYNAAHENRNACGAFSLLELLAAILVISILAALLFPTVQRLIDQSRSTQCSAKLRSLGAEVIAAMADENGAMPWYERPKGNSGMWWHKTLSKDNFENFNKKMTCGSLNDPYKLKFSPNGRKLTGNYRYNKYMGYQDKTGVWVYPLTPMQSVSKPGKLVMLADDRTVIENEADDSLGFEEWKTVIRAHRAKTLGVVICLDGHGEFITEENKDKFAIVPQKLDKL